MNDYEYAETLKIIKYATQMEIDGKDFYRIASQKSSSELGKKLLNQLIHCLNLNPLRNRGPAISQGHRV